MMNPVLIFKIAVRIVQRFTMRFVVGCKPLRNAVTRWAVWRKQPKALPVSTAQVFETFEKEKYKNDLATNGYAKGAFVNQDYVQAVLDYCRMSNATLGLKDQARVKRKEIYIPVNAVKAPIHGVSYYYYYDVHNKCEAVRDIVFNENLLSVVRDYLGAEPTLLFSNIIWTFPVHNKGQRVDEVGQFGFHFDIPDFKSLAVFVYLSDVDEDCGPHVVIGGTHQKKPLQSLLLNTLSRRKARRKYQDRIEVFTGKKGTAVIEDIYSYHKATNPHKPRLALKFFFGVQRETMIHNRNLRDFKKTNTQKRRAESLESVSV